MNTIKFAFFVLLLVGMMSCKDDKPANNTSTTVPNTEVVAQYTPGEGSYMGAILPDMNNAKVQLLLESPYWVAEYWVNNADNEQNAPNKCRWWSLKPDGTFTTGQWEETFTHGTWAVHFDRDKELLHLDAADDALDMEFHMQGVSNQRDYMAWAGTSTYDQSRIAVKAIKLLTMPTKQQFNVSQ